MVLSEIWARTSDAHDGAPSAIPVVGAWSMEPIVVRSAEGKHNKTAVEWAVIVALIGLTCITVWIYVSVSFNAPEAGANASVSRSDTVETTGSIQSQKKHRAPRP